MNARKKPQITTEVVTITPTLAQEWLEVNRNNRTPRKTHVARLARDMAEGRWKMTGEAIAFDSEGNLQNGQHRLMAIIEAAVKVPMLVVRGVPPESFDVIDQGSVRTTGDALRALGIPDPSLIGAASRLVLMYEQYPDKSWNSVNQKLTKTEITTYAEQHAPGLVLAEAASRHWHFGRSRYSATVAGGYLLHRKHGGSEAFTAFSEGLVTGADLPKNSPVLALRNYIINSNNGRRASLDRWSQQKMVFAIVKAWNYYLEDNAVDHLRVTPSSLPMPEVR